MYYFLKYSQSAFKQADILKEILNKKNINLIYLFEINLENKEKSKENISKILHIIKSKNIEHKALLIKIEKVDNYIPGFINSLKEDFDVLLGEGGLNKINRYFLEQSNIDILLDPQSSKQKLKIDFIHHLNSGFNHILSKIAIEKNIKIYFSLNFFIRI
jgi:RNase P/RNase MRP subunit p30